MLLKVFLHSSQQYQRTTGFIDRINEEASSFILNIMDKNEGIYLLLESLYLYQSLF